MDEITKHLLIKKLYYQLSKTQAQFALIETKLRARVAGSGQ